MRDCLRLGTGALAVVALLSAGTALSRAAGALAIGKCAAYGYAYDYPSVKEAEAAVLQKCDGSCKQVVTTVKGCVEFAVVATSPAARMALTMPSGLAPPRTRPRSTATSTAARTA